MSPRASVRAKLAARLRASTAADCAAVADMRAAVEDVAKEAEEQIRDLVWEPIAEERELARQAAEQLSAALGPPEIQQELAAIERLEHLREALAVLALTLARVHGRLAWFLAAASTALTPVLHWRALPTTDWRTFGAIEPTTRQYAEAEDAVRRIRDALTRIATTV